MLNPSKSKNLIGGAPLSTQFGVYARLGSVANWITVSKSATDAIFSFLGRSPGIALHQKRPPFETLLFA
jgi:hypothetical protein